ncbi:hypothetical protein EDF77_0892 [Stenotrophomonas maltophilia]|uniref:hypothetical protein n=1 Tax=Stenotrophomonas chelatiphaga TaxID=517011 RepID=UPI000FBA4894|nr:hypothetical protein [Stenotrophomonas chelatiphaga]MCS4229557.1 hypothetical protein [Stenotrophomonas chelatiphaga]ROQ45994.1 hypothetical protein EDF77_0892 [Stenotrophomonas maltophilia]
MDTLPTSVASAEQGRSLLSSLRRHQRRLLLGGGGLVSLLILATLLVAVLSDIDAFHAAQQRRFAEARASVDYFLFQRDRAYAANINGSEAMWAGQQAALQAQGRPLADRFLAAGSQLVVRAEGRTAVPWLVLGAKDNPLPRAQLDAYLGIMVEYSAYTASTVTALRASGPVTMYLYEPQGRLLAVAGVADEAQLLRALRVGSREEAFTRLLVNEERARAMRPLAGPVESAAASGRLISRFDTNPITGQPSLVGVQTLLQGREPAFRRIVFEPVQTIKARLDERVSGAYAVVTRDGRTVLRSAGMPRDVSPALAGRIAGSGGGDGRMHRGGEFIVHGPVRGVDWTVLHFYGWGDLWHEKGGRMLAQTLASAVILLALWLLLLRLHRRVFTPALADAARVYESEALSRVIIDT